MSELLHQLIEHSAARAADTEALRHKKQSLSYGELNLQLKNIAQGLLRLGLQHQQRVAIYLPKQFETVIAFFATSYAGATFVPINPLLKGEQVAYILNDCNAHLLITSKTRLAAIADAIGSCSDLQHIICVDSLPDPNDNIPFPVTRWEALSDDSAMKPFKPAIDSDMAAILYTSGSTGKPKGVVLSHRNMVAGAKSVAQYLHNDNNDRLLAVLPFSFDYGFSQLSTAFLTGACTVLMDYLLPRDVIKAVEREKITGLAAVPPLWIQLAQLPWPEGATNTLRYITNSGGAMPTATLGTLRKTLPDTAVYLMYGLTEAFRSTYLDPAQLDKRPDSIGKAIPNAEILVVREDGSPCAPGEPGELVHRGTLVAMGYWNDRQKTQERFKPAPGQIPAIPLTEIAVWSGDSVRIDEEGFLYFIGRKDEMIKTSGYRVSPTEVEEVIYQTGLVDEAVALGIPHTTLGHAILVVASPMTGKTLDTEQLQNECKKCLPGYMVPTKIVVCNTLPRNPNGKIDRKHLVADYQDIFEETEK